MKRIGKMDLIALAASVAFIGGTSSGARLSMLFNQRHPQNVKGLLLMRVTGGDFAAGRLPETYYGQFIKAAQQGGMKAVCDHEQYQERIQANPSNLPRLMAMDPFWLRAVLHYDVGDPEVSRLKEALSTWKA